MKPFVQYTLPNVDYNYGRCHLLLFICRPQILSVHLYVHVWTELAYHNPPKSDFSVVRVF